MTDPTWIFEATGALNELFAVAVIEVANGHGLGQEMIRYANPLLCELAGYEPDALTDRPLDLLLPARSREAHHHYSRGYKARPEPRPMGPDREVVLLHKSGVEIRVWVGLAPHDEHHVTAAIMPMDIGRSFGLPSAKRPINGAPKAVAPLA